MNSICPFLLAFLFFSVAQADTHFVDLAGGDVFPYTTPATAAQNPADALEAASSGDRVAIADGVYDVPVQLDGSGLTLEGASTNTVLRGSGSNRVLVATDSSLLRLTIENGFALASRGAGAAVTNSVVTGCVFQDNEMGRGTDGFGILSTIWGAGLYAENSRISESVFRRNIDGEELEAACHAPHVQGGGAYLIGCEVRACRFSDNRSDDGAAFWATESTLEDCKIQGNTMRIWHPVVLNNSTLRNSVVCRNTWGVWAQNRSEVLDCDITDNVGGFGALAFNIVCSNPPPGGGGVLLETGSVVRRCRITGNSSGFGAGVMIWSSSSRPSVVQNCLIAGNQLQSRDDIHPGSGAGILVYGAATIEHCTFADNVSTGEGAVVESPSINTGDELVFRNNIVWGNQGATLKGEWPLANFTSNILQGTNVDDNLSVDPLLQPDYRLSPNSPAIGRGDSTNPPPGLTLFGLPRVLAGSTDIGADEHHPEPIIATAEMTGTDQANVTLNSLPGVIYQVEFSPELAPAPNWTPASQRIISGSGNTTTIAVPAPGNLGAYRVRIFP